jgi:2-amino-4-hydroxy-6-hydroxymethyldihydropteridine diphosphokinase
MTEPIPEPIADKKSIHIALALGSNVGDREAALRAAVKALSPYVKVTAISPVYETSPVYVTDQPSFYNAAVTGTTTLEPLALLWTLKDIENSIGRLPTFRYGPRVIDIDIIFYGDRIVKTSELTIPHARMAEREFVLRPLNTVAPNMQHPETGRTVADMLGQLPDDGMTRLDIDL